MTIIVMTREMGTLGKDVAREFANRTGYGILHHELVPGSRHQTGLEEESEVFRHLEGSEEELSKWRGSRLKDGFLTPQEIFEIALEGNILIRGWGASRLLKSVPNVLSVRVCAPMEFRVGIMMSRLGVNERAARQEISRSDAAHSRTFLRFFESDWRDPLNYDVVLNTAHLDPVTCAEVLMDTIATDAFVETEETRRHLTDRLLEEKIKSVIHSDAALESRGQHIQVTVHDSDVRLFGFVKDGLSRATAEKLVGCQPGVKHLQNEIAQVSAFAD